MSTLTTIAASDLITDSRSVINNNFAALNTDKIETSYLDTDTSMAANSDTKIPTQKAVKAYIDTLGGVNASEALRGIVEEATDAEVTAGTATGGTGAKLFVTPAKLLTRMAAGFGGTGADGALTITSGTTTINLGSAATIIKNYTTISITGTGALAFSNPHANGTLVILKCQGAVTITSSANPTIDLRSLGGTAGTGGGTNTNGNDGSYGISTIVANMDYGMGGTTAGVGGVGGVTFGPAVAGTLTINGKMVPFGCGGGGGGGAGGFGGTNTAAGGGGGSSLVAVGTAGGNGTANSTNGSGGNGGRGGGALYIECGGALNITSVINAAGAVGSAATTSGGGGGGGGGGTIVILYKTLTANSGTYTVTGGAGGSGVANGGTGGTGGTGASLVAANTEFV